jgi:hypothetical protein
VSQWMKIKLVRTKPAPQSIREEIVIKPTDSKKRAYDLDIPFEKALILAEMFYFHLELRYNLILLFDLKGGFGERSCIWFQDRDFYNRKYKYSTAHKIPFTKCFLIYFSCFSVALDIL